MLTITFSRDGRFWYGRRRYKVRISGAAPESMRGIKSGDVSIGEGTEIMLTVIRREQAAGRHFQIVDNR